MASEVPLAPGGRAAHHHFRDARHRRRARPGTTPAILIPCDEAGSPACLADLIDNLGVALLAAAADDDMCPSAANTVTTARPMLLIAPVTSAVFSWSLVAIVGSPADQARGSRPHTLSRRPHSRGGATSGPLAQTLRFARERTDVHQDSSRPRRVGMHRRTTKRSRSGSRPESERPAPTGPARRGVCIVAHGAAIARLLLRELAGPEQNSPVPSACPATQLRIRDTGTDIEDRERSVPVHLRGPAALMSSSRLARLCLCTTCYQVRGEGRPASGDQGAACSVSWALLSLQRGYACRRSASWSQSTRSIHVVVWNRADRSSIDAAEWSASGSVRFLGFVRRVRGSAA